MEKYKIYGELYSNSFIKHKEEKKFSGQKETQVFFCQEFEDPVHGNGTILRDVVSSRTTSASKACSPTAAGADATSAFGSS